MLIERLQRKFANRSPQSLGQELYKRSAVLLPLVEVNEEWAVLFEKRSARLKSQPGEICFPGGRIEEGEDPETTAVRETCEELQLPENAVEVMGPLDVMVAPFPAMIYPYLGRILRVHEIDPHPDEVETVFTVPLSFFQENIPLRRDIPVLMHPPEDFPFHLITNRERYTWKAGNFPELFYQYGEHVIWGITARILYNFLFLAGMVPLPLPPALGTDGQTPR